MGNRRFQARCVLCRQAGALAVLLCLLLLCSMCFRAFLLMVGPATRRREALTPARSSSSRRQPLPSMPQSSHSPSIDRSTHTHQSTHPSDRAHERSTGLTFPFLTPPHPTPFHSSIGSRSPSGASWADSTASQASASNHQPTSTDNHARHAPPRDRRRGPRCAPPARCGEQLGLACLSNHHPSGGPRPDPPE